jgi:hypothetical protein
MITEKWSEDIVKAVWAYHHHHHHHHRVLRVCPCGLFQFTVTSNVMTVFRHLTRVHGRVQPVGRFLPTRDSQTQKDDDKRPRFERDSNPLSPSPRGQDLRPSLSTLKIIYVGLYIYIYVFVFPQKVSSWRLSSADVILDVTRQFYNYSLARFEGLHTEHVFLVRRRAS